MNNLFVAGWGFTWYIWLNYCGLRSQFMYFWLKVLLHRTRLICGCTIQVNYVIATCRLWVSRTSWCRTFDAPHSPEYPRPARCALQTVKDRGCPYPESSRPYSAQRGGLQRIIRNANWHAYRHHIVVKPRNIGAATSVSRLPRRRIPLDALTWPPLQGEIRRTKMDM